MRRARCFLAIASIVLSLFFLSIFSLSTPGMAVMVVDLAKVVDSAELGDDANYGGDYGVYGDYDNDGDDANADDDGDYDIDDVVPAPVRG